MNDSNKMSGYEIRLELIKLAKEMAIDRFYNEREPLYNEYLQKIENMKNNSNWKEELPILPTYPTAQDINKLATKLYQFVLKRNWSEENHD